MNVFISQTWGRLVEAGPAPPTAHSHGPSHCKGSSRITKRKKELLNKDLRDLQLAIHLSL